MKKSIIIIPLILILSMVGANAYVTNNVNLPVYESWLQKIFSPFTGSWEVTSGTTNLGGMGCLYIEKEDKTYCPIYGSNTQSVFTLMAAYPPHPTCSAGGSFALANEKSAVEQLDASQGKTGCTWYQSTDMPEWWLHCCTGSSGATQCTESQCNIEYGCKWLDSDTHYHVTKTYSNCPTNCNLQGITTIGASIGDPSSNPKCVGGGQPACSDKGIVCQEGKICAWNSQSCSFDCQTCSDNLVCQQGTERAYCVETTGKCSYQGTTLNKGESKCIGTSKITCSPTGNGVTQADNTASNGCAQVNKYCCYGLQIEGGFKWKLYDVQPAWCNSEGVNYDSSGLNCGSSPVETCSSTKLNLCTTQSSCESKGGEWKNTACVVKDGGGTTPVVVTDNRTQIALTKEEWDAGTSAYILASSCDYPWQCKARENYTVSCITDAIIEKSNLAAYDSGVKSKLCTVSSADISIIGLFKLGFQLLGGGYFCESEKAFEGTCRATPVVEKGSYCDYLVWAPDDFPTKKGSCTNGVYIILIVIGALIVVPPLLKSFSGGK